MVKLDQISGDKVHGAREITLRGVVYLGEHVRDLDAKMPVDKARQKIATAAQELIDAQPTMAPLFNVANSLLLAIEPAKTTEDIMALSLKLLEDERFHEAYELDNLGQKAQELYIEGMRILIHSHSSTIIHLLKNAKDQGLSFYTLVSEGRPVMEGRLTAKELQEHGIPVNVVCDAAVTVQVKDADIVLLGTDAVTTQGIVNKTGSLSLVLAAKYYGKPVYIITTSEKFFPSKAGTVPIEEHDPIEVWQDAPSGICIENYYFEYVPLDLLTGIITEEGILSAEEVLSRLDDLPVSKHIRAPQG